MKTQNNIEEQFEKLKDAYHVPEGYFEQITVPKQPRSKLLNLRGIRTYLAAAVILLLVTLGYKVWHWQQNKTRFPQKPATEITNNNQIFEDLTDDEIIEYLSDEDFYELNL